MINVDITCIFNHVFKFRKSNLFPVLVYFWSFWLGFHNFFLKSSCNYFSSSFISSACRIIYYYIIILSLFSLTSLTSVKPSAIFSLLSCPEHSVLWLDLFLLWWFSSLCLSLFCRLRVGVKGRLPEVECMRYVERGVFAPCSRNLKVLTSSKRQTPAASCPWFNTFCIASRLHLKTFSTTYF